MMTNADLGEWDPPAGWTVEFPEWMPDCVIIGNRNGWVTVNTKTRAFCLGHSTCDYLPKQRFYGRDWKTRLFLAAEQSLRSAGE